MRRELAAGLTGLLLTLVGMPASAQSLEELRREVAALRQSVKPLSEARQEQAGVDLRADITMAPVVDIINAFAAQGVEQRKVKLDISGVFGNILDEYSECHFLGINIGRRGYHMYMPNASGFHVHGWLDNGSAAWSQAGGLSVTGRLRSDVFVPLLHAHVDPLCIGGGIGFDIGPISCPDVNLAVSGSVTVSGAGTGPIEFTVPASVAGNVQCSVNLGSILPALNVEIPVNYAAELKGTFEGTLRKSGDIELKDPQMPFKRHYELQVGPVAISNWQRGVRVRTPLTITFTP